ncbi:hypothetical protein QJQ58_13545 [Paenibacillus dendritiformis]|uniref:Uncharacterized protein n=1 Tax=Paenibacillus dendritiformis C454 TaxID=1131935 RepID=H3SID4_9BACL|nr:hypothetical protein [Paenibacillus dendritiformis]EHQ61192.1 hypothetical protein PDENDC454_16538 [Paenibacillus dendritiformis C454]WGU97203.1 hypothetical protein QJQ58_13545 [Paenibacillus dendritiformis]CAH8769574.1 hypothetical protein H7S4_002305 [Paenibacillus dendritiformis]
MKMSIKRGLPIVALATGLVIASITPNTLIAQSIASKTVAGGWDEKNGYFTISNNTPTSLSLAASSPKHEGSVESAYGGKNVLLERAVGKTTWEGVYHYSRARFEGRLTGKITADSDRVWGTSETEAYSDWIDRFLTDWAAKTYYGNE